MESLPRMETLSTSAREEVIVGKGDCLLPNCRSVLEILQALLHVEKTSGAATQRRADPVASQMINARGKIIRDPLLFCKSEAPTKPESRPSPLCATLLVLMFDILQILVFMPFYSR
jgi:hypothetical protein